MGLKLRLIWALFLSFACNNEYTNCPPGAFIDEWQVISDSKSTARLDCSRQISLKLADHGSVWISSTKYRHDVGIATLGAMVTGCMGRTVVMSVGMTTKPATASGDYYSLGGDVIDPWLVAIGVQSEVACEATINRIEYQLTPYTDMSYAPRDMSSSPDLLVEDMSDNPDLAN